MAPVQKRAILTRENILSAVETLLVQREFEQVSIADIAREAGVAVGSVYSHFKDKEALLPVLMERRLDRAEARIRDFAANGKMDAIDMPNGAGVDLKTTVRSFFLAARQIMLGDVGLVRALITYRRIHPDRDIPRREKVNEDFMEAFLIALQPHSDQIALPDLRQAAKMAYYLANIAYLDEAVLRNPALAQSLAPDEGEKLQAFTRMLYLYLTRGEEDG